MSCIGGFARLREVVEADERPVAVAVGEHDHVALAAEHTRLRVGRVRPHGHSGPTSA